jgi:hypothetical protein
MVGIEVRRPDGFQEVQKKIKSLSYFDPETQRQGAPQQQKLEPGSCCVMKKGKVKVARLVGGAVVDVVNHLSATPCRVQGYKVGGGRTTRDSIVGNGGSQSTDRP